MKSRYLFQLLGIGTVASFSTAVACKVAVLAEILQVPLSGYECWLRYWKRRLAGYSAGSDTGSADLQGTSAGFADDSGSSALKQRVSSETRSLRSQPTVVRVIW